MCNTFGLNFHFRQHIDFNDTTYKQKKTSNQNKIHVLIIEEIPNFRKNKL